MKLDQADLGKPFIEFIPSEHWVASKLVLRVGKDGNVGIGEILTSELDIEGGVAIPDDPSPPANKIDIGKVESIPLYVT